MNQKTKCTGTDGRWKDDNQSLAKLIKRNIKVKIMVRLLCGKIIYRKRLYRVNRARF